MSALRELSADLVAVECGFWGSDAAFFLCDHNAKAALNFACQMRDASRRTRNPDTRRQFRQQMRSHAIRWRMYARDVHRLSRVA